MHAVKKKMVAFRFSQTTLHRLDNLVEEARRITDGRSLWRPHAGRTSVIVGLIGAAFALARTPDAEKNKTPVKPKNIKPIPSRKERRTRR